MEQTKDVPQWPKSLLMPDSEGNCYDSEGNKWMPIFMSGDGSNNTIGGIRMCIGYRKVGAISS